MSRTVFLAALALAIAGSALAQMTLPVDSVTNDLVAKYGDAQRERAARGVKQIAGFWRAEDGDATAFAEFAKTNFAGDAKTIDALFDRMEFAFEQVDGHMLEIGRELRRQSDLDIGPIYPFDEIMAGYDPSAHLNDDLFANKLAFVVLLNFPLTTLDQRLTDGNSWSRRQWAEARLAQRFSRRVPADVNLAIAKAGGEAAQFVATYNIWMHHLVDASGTRLFPAKMRLLEHWNLRDEIKAEYSEGKAGLAKQRTIQKVMERIVDQSIPNDVVDNPNVDWNPSTNAVKPAAVKDADNYSPQAPIREANARYATILKVFHASKLADPYSPTAPTLIARRFDEGRELPEARVRAMLEQIVASPLVPRVAALIAKRLGRPLEPFDIWYNGFRPRGAFTDTQLDAITRKKYPTAEAYHADMPRLFRELGFSEERAFVFQNRDMELLGLSKPSAESDALKTLNEFWGTYEIAGVALVDMGMWHWMYDHPNATPAELKDAVVQISKDIWNRYYAPVFHTRDETLLGVYAHMVDSFLYLPDYPIGHMIAFQIEEQMKKAGAVGSEFERMAKMGSVTPDLWMKNATGAPVGPEALLAATERAVGVVK